MAIPFQSEIEVPTIKFKQSTASSVPTTLAARTLGFGEDKLYFGDTTGRPIPCNGIVPLNIKGTNSDSPITGQTSGLIGKYTASDKIGTGKTGTLFDAICSQSDDYSIGLAADPKTTTKISITNRQNYSIVGGIGNFGMMATSPSIVTYFISGYAILR